MVKLLYMNTYRPMSMRNCETEEYPLSQSGRKDQDLSSSSSSSSIVVVVVVVVVS